jgi:hypothetical protein
MYTNQPNIYRLQIEICQDVEMYKNVVKIITNQVGSELISQRHEHKTASVFPNIWSTVERMEHYVYHLDRAVCARHTPMAYFPSLYTVILTGHTQAVRIHRTWLWRTNITYFITPIHCLQWHTLHYINQSLRSHATLRYSRPGLVIWAIARCTLIGRYLGLMWCSSALGRLTFLSMGRFTGRWYG